MRNSLSIHQHPTHLLWIMLFSKFRKKHTAVSPLPALVNGYHLREELDSGELIKPHRIGIYENARGQKAVVKWWTGKSKTFAYHSLLHEVAMFTLFTKVQKRIAGKIGGELSHIHTPRLISSKTTNENIMMMTEFSESKLLRESGNEKQISQYFLSLHFLETLSENLTDKEKESLPKREVSDYLSLYPALLSVAMLRQPKYRVTLLRGVPFVLSTFAKIWKQSLTLVHRDLHTKNILVSSKETTIIDLQRVVLTYELYELVTTLAVEWENKVFRQYVLNSVSPKSRNVFRGLMVHFATHALTANNLPERYLSRYKAMLKFAVNDFPTYYRKTYEN